MREGDDVFAPARTERSAADVLFNGTPVAWRLGLTVADVLAGQATDAASVATAVNGRFVAREDRAGMPLWPGDALIAFRAIVGG
jgi:sulfur carrier protein